MTDEEMIRRIKRGEKEYLNDLIGRYYDDIYRFCIYQTGNETCAHDLSQDTFLRFIRSVDTFECRNVKGYLLTIASNLCKDYFRSRIVIKSIDEVMETGKEESGYETAGQKIELYQALQKLPKGQREIIILRFYSDMKIGEISEILTVNLSTVKTRLRAGIKNLRSILEVKD